MKTLIKNGFIADGTGVPGFVGSVTIENDRISGVFRVEEAEFDEGAFDSVYDASGSIVSPGFIDAHSHSDAYLVIEPDAPSKLSQGVTTEINGQCGGSIAPRYAEARLSGDWAEVLGERLNWRSLAEYRETLAQAKPAINTVQFIGHNTLRSSVIGYAGRPAAAEELERMKSLLARELDDGGWGLTTGLIYQPGKYSDNAEVVALAKTAAERGGFYATHMRSEGDRLLESIDEVIELVKTTGIRAEISHLKTSGGKNWRKIDAALEKMQTAVDSGLLLGADRYPFCAAGTDLDVVFPDWAGEGGAKAECVRLADSAQRRRIIDELNASGRDWATVMIGGTWSQCTREFSGHTIAEIVAGQSGKSVGEVVCDILTHDRCLTGAFFFGMNESNMKRILSQPWTVPGSDASLRAPWGVLGQDHPHPRAYGTMPEYFRVMRESGFSLEETVSRMTSLPARRFEIPGRGVVAPGAYADVAVWKMDEFRNTANYAVSHSFCSGMQRVFVNGAVAFDHGVFTHSGTGRFLERCR